MRIIEEESFDAIVYAWLKTEWIKNGHDRKHARFKPLIDTPDFSSRRQNILRERVLGEQRRDFLEGIPRDTRWYTAAYDPDDIDKIYMITSSCWLPISSHTYHLPRTLLNIDSEFEHASRIREMYRALPNPELDTKLIILASDLDSPKTIMEGNHRAPALLKFDQEHPFQQTLLQTVFLGLSGNMKQNAWHIEHHRNEHAIRLSQLNATMPP